MDTNEEPVGLVWKGVEVRRQPPYRVFWCKSPTRRNAQGPCGFAAQTCAGESKACEWCQRRFCEYHMPGHRIRGDFPPDRFRGFLAKLAADLDEAAAAQAHDVESNGTG